MKKQFVTLLFIVLSTVTNAQVSAVKAGGNYNADFASHKLGKMNYPSWEISYERGLGKKFSINGSFNYARRTYDLYNGPYLLADGSLIYGAEGIIEYDQIFILEGRYYLKSNNSGIFFQMGIPFTYTTSVRSLNSTSNQYSYSLSSNYFAISTFGGLGIKYPLTLRFGIEMNMSISPSFNFLDVDYGSSGFIKTGVKLFYSFDKIKK